MLVPLSMAVLGIVSCDVLRENEILVLRLLAGAATLVHVHFVVSVVKQMCRHFNINCFSLKKSQKTSLKK